MNTIEPMDKNYFDIEEYIHRVQSFHGHVAPGVVIGGFMVHLAKTQISDKMLFDAISETPACRAGCHSTAHPVYSGKRLAQDY